MNTQEIKQAEDRFTTNTYTRYDAALVRGEGARAFGPEGQAYIDFTSGIGVNSLGFCDPQWVEAVQAQAAALQHASNLFYTEPCARAAESLMKLTGMRNMFFANSGAEANEGAIKAARKYSFEKYGKGREDSFDRYRIVTLSGSFHGRTIATITATAQPTFHRYFTPFLQGFDYTETNKTETLERHITDKTCAVMVEFVQGEGGVVELDGGFVREIDRLCRERDILLIADEVQTGVGRTGRFMAYEHFDVRPDIITVAKGLGGGLPIGGVLFGEKTCDVLKPGDHGSTYGGNPVVCAGAEAVLKRFEDGGLLHEIAEKGAYMREKIVAMSGVKAVSGLGLMIGIDIGDKDLQAVTAACLKGGLLILTAKNRLRLLPPLTISRGDIDEGLAILAPAIQKAPKIKK
ncbi:MAG: acetylornithine/succinylornithine family transaminase [Clostridiales bacterium]|nr:acetylornithine/succinylornithine family transaminase [Clostridiales bacterium]